jgi:hypothetical protein
VRTKEWLYLENFRTESAWQGPADSVRSPSFTQLLSSHKSGDLSQAQADVFLAPRPAAELYHLGDDPHQLSNLADYGDFTGIKRSLSSVLKVWMLETGDSNPEQISADEFDRETGLRIVSDQSYRHETPGESKFASEINRHGLR